MRLPSLLAFLMVVGCGSSAERSRETPPVTTPPQTDAGSEDVPPPLTPRRTMKQVGILGGVAVENLLIDPNFEQGEFGIGRWLTSFTSAPELDGPRLSQLVISDSPIGIALPVGTMQDLPETGSPRTMSLLAQVVGGTGPYLARIWIATDDIAGETESPLPLVRVSLATASASAFAGVEIKPDAATTRMIGGRSWTQFSGETPGPYSLGAWLTVRFKASKHRWYMQGPEVLPKGLVPTPTRSLILHPVLSRELDHEEMVAVDRYRRQPVRFGPIPPKPFGSFGH